MNRLPPHLPEMFRESLPPTAELLRVAFRPRNVAGGTVLLELPPYGARRAVRLDDSPCADGVGADGDGADSGGKPAPQADLEVLTIVVDQPIEPETLTRVRDWCELGAAQDPARPGVWTAVHGAQIGWSPGRAVVLASAERLPLVRDELLRAAYLESELSRVERAIGADWPQLDADLPHAFEFGERSRAHRRQLRERFQGTLRLRAQLEQLRPFLEAPHVYPPTVASQVGERFRERTRLPQRLEWVSEQLGVYERVYELCGDRASDFTHARTGHTLEWIIIVLLIAQIVLTLFEVMALIEH